MGWRYTMWACGALVFALSVARVTVIRLKETPKYLLGMGEDAVLVENMQALAKKYGRSCSLTLEKLEACGRISSAHSEDRFSFEETLVHLRGLFCTTQIAISTLLIWLSWTLIGLAYPLFYVFLRYNRGSSPGCRSQTRRLRNPGPRLALGLSMVNVTC